MSTLKLPTCKHGCTDECLACYDDEIARLHALVDIAYDHLLSRGYTEEGPTLTKLREGLKPGSIKAAK